MRSYKSRRLSKAKRKLPQILKERRSDNQTAFLNLELWSYKFVPSKLLYVVVAVQKVINRLCERNEVTKQSHEIRQNVRDCPVKKFICRDAVKRHFVTSFLAKTIYYFLDSLRSSRGASLWRDKLHDMAIFFSNVKMRLSRFMGSRCRLRHATERQKRDFAVKLLAKTVQLGFLTSRRVESSTCHGLCEIGRYMCWLQRLRHGEEAVRNNAEIEVLQFAALDSELFVRKPFRCGKSNICEVFSI